MSIHALASLTATYTDSEPEGEEEDQVLQDNKSKSSNSSPSSRAASVEPIRPTETQKVATLVSYNDDILEEDDEEGGELRANDAHSADVDVELPPEPTGRVSPRIIEKISRLHEKMEAGMDMNSNIQNRKDFRNPSIYEKLIHYCEINEFGTNYPPRIYDPFKWGKESFYEELALVQKADMDKREKEKKEKDKKDKVKGEFLLGASKVGVVSDDDLKKRKSKWDQVGSGSIVGLLRSTGMIHPGLTSAASGTKATVISAFGSLPKKPKI